MPIHTTHTRDAALRDLHRINRWLIAGSVLLTGALSDVAAHAFPGKTVKRTASAKASSASPHGRQHKSRSSHTTTGVLKPPAQTPKASTESSAPPQETQPSQSAPAHESAPAQESAPTESHASAPAQEAAQPAESQTPAPAEKHESQPAQEAPATPEAAPEQSAPVVSGGS